jgi:hypothetical protein
MPHQSKIIHAVNARLKQKPDIEFELNHSGVCAGLAGLFIKNILENKEHDFFYLLDQLSVASNNLPALDELIINIEKVYRPDKYSSFTLEQGDLHKILYIVNKPLRNEFNFGLVAQEDHWEKILEKITRNNRSYFITSEVHALALSYKTGKYTLYDPNYPHKPKTFASAKEVIKELKQCFKYKKSTFGLSIRAFANPHFEEVEYPSHESLLQLAAPNPIFTQEDKSAIYAGNANDITSIRYLLQKDPRYLSSLDRALLQSEVVKLLLEQSNSSEVKNTLLNAISLNFWVGNSNTTQQLIEHYQKNYYTETEQLELQNKVHDLLNSPINDLFQFPKKVVNYEWFLQLARQYNFHNNPQCKTIYNHLQLLSFIETKAKQDEIDLFLKNCSPQQLKQQIEYTAIANQHQILDLLINIKAPAEIQSLIFTPQVIKHAQVSTLKKLLDKGFIPNIEDPSLLTNCMQRKDKTIFELMANARTQQNKQQAEWESIYNNKYKTLDLSQKLDSVCWLSILVFLRKNVFIKKAWTANIPIEVIKAALFSALQYGNVEMCQFLQEHLLKNNVQLEQEDQEYLFEQAILQEDFTCLNLLSYLKFNVLCNTKHLNLILSLCQIYDDYSIIFAAFDNASLKVKQYLLFASLNNELNPLIEFCAQKEPQLFNLYLNKSITNKTKITQLNQVVHLLPAKTLKLGIEQSEQKEFIKKCVKAHLFPLVQQLMNNTTWADKELILWYDELLQTSNEKAIIQLLQMHPELQNKPNLLEELTQKNLLSAVDMLLTTETSLRPELLKQIFTAAMVNNNKNVIYKCLQLGFNVESKETLMPLLEQAISLGNTQALELYLHMPYTQYIDFKTLFFASCEHKQANIANLLLAQELILSNEEIHLSLKKLFGDLSTVELFETIYQNGYGRLYQLLFHTEVSNPRKDLLFSIKNPKADPKFQQTQFYLVPLKRAIKEKNKAVFEMLFAETNSFNQVNEQILAFLQDPIMSVEILPIFIKKYTLRALLLNALQNNQWSVVANLVEHAKFSDLDADVKESLQKSQATIIKSYIANLEEHSNLTDVRPRLFQLMVKPAEKALQQLATAHHPDIHEALTRIELAMLKEHRDLNGHSYRYSLDTDSFSNALEQLSQKFTQCTELITAQKIDLKTRVESPELIKHFAQIKTLMSQHEVTPYYLSDEQEELLEKLIENPRFKKVCQQELQLYSFGKQYNLKEKTLEQLKYEEKIQFHSAVKTIKKALKKEKLPPGFAIPEVQIYIQMDALDQRRNLSCQAIQLYQAHRDETLGYLSYYFDYERGKTRAIHYENLIKSAKSFEEIYILEYALLINNNSKQINQNVAHGLSHIDPNDAKTQIKKIIRNSRLMSNLEQIDQIIELINHKANTNDKSETEILFEEEISCLRSLCAPQSSLSQQSFFQIKAPKPTGFWRWLMSWLHETENVKLAEPNRPPH